MKDMGPDVTSSPRRPGGPGMIQGQARIATDHALGRSLLDAGAGTVVLGVAVSPPVLYDRRPPEAEGAMPLESEGEKRPEGNERESTRLPELVQLSDKLTRLLVWR